MELNHMSKTHKLTLSAMMIAIYVVAMYCTQSSAFGAYQIRIATAIYALSYLFPFLVLPLGFANFLSNALFGGLGPLDMLGGCLVGLITTALIVLIRRQGWNRWLIALPILLVPGLGVATWLSYLLQIPYPAMAFSLCVGQIAPAICGVLLVRVLERVLQPRTVRPSAQR